MYKRQDIDFDAQLIRFGLDAVAHALPEPVSYTHLYSVDDIAAAANTVNYEILCDIGRRVPRVYVENGREVDFVNYLEGE